MENQDDLAASLPVKVASAHGAAAGVTTVEATRADTADIMAQGPVDGMGEPHADGSYVQIVISDRRAVQRYRISRGAAEVLIAELQGALPDQRAVAGDGPAVVARSYPAEPA